MYSNYFGMDEPPFSIAPNPRYLFLSKQHREALAHLLYGISSNGGFVLLTGEVGTGKTTVCRALLDQLPDNTDIALILNPKCDSEELLAAICDELHISYPKSEGTRLKDYIDALNDYLLDAHARGRNTFLILDEAQNLGVSVLEQIRLLTNLETDCSKLLQIVLIGQPELLTQLQQPELRQLSQRITARYHLGSLSRSELEAYVSHRLSVAGVQGRLFPVSTLNRLFRITKGIPRLINVVCDRALLGAFVERQNRVEVNTLTKAAGEVLGENNKTGMSLNLWQTVALLLLITTSLGWVYQSQLKTLSAPWLNRFNSSTIAAEAPPIAVPAVPAAPAVPDKPLSTVLLATQTWPDNSGRERNQVYAYRSLFQRWGVEYDPRSHPIVCRYARELGYDCLFNSGSLDKLIELNRPAVVKLGNTFGDFYATLVAIQDDQAELLLDNQRLILPLSDLQPFWRETYTLFWKLPPNYSGMIQPGSQLDNVEWLSRQMALITGRPADNFRQDIYSPRLVKEVKAFQHSKGLLADGIIGPRTAIHLNSATSQSVPRLVQDG